MKLEEFYRSEEKLNALSHAVGVLLAISGGVLLIPKVGLNAGYATISVVVYSASLLLLFSASTMYHAVSVPVVKNRLRILDHISIFALIAGTYTPVALITLINGNGWAILYTVWGIALFGTVFKLFYTGKLEFLSLLLYLVMGWLIVLDLENLLAHTSTRGLWLLALGGAFYTLGIFFYAFRRIPYNHLIWHFFVLGGAISHWLYIYLDVV
ncbi:PAQR family membrane homeostasis protein TrhA [Muriicola sp. Z0-33]|uniref:PAQR family membrane homeostasis protein TrhA n=1 Tax=Muriicola sp. Z0-33 TaxID=2816957 RepID=UPI0022373849|nr:hemolysin III family protein [Muriicola sp. Z0-33]MCW5516498.1 hemolysin III family protein [Muriicola sp. Z0-33]